MCHHHIFAYDECDWWDSRKWFRKVLTLILPTQKVITLCHQYRARPAFTSVHPDQTLYCRLTNFKFPSWYPLKWQWTVPETEGGLFHLKNSAWKGLTFKNKGTEVHKTRQRYIRKNGGKLAILLSEDLENQYSYFALFIYNKKTEFIYYDFKYNCA